MHNDSHYGDSTYIHMDIHRTIVKMIDNKDTSPTRQSKIKKGIKCLGIKLWRARHNKQALTL